MHPPLSKLPASQQWLLIAEFTFGLSFLISMAATAFLIMDRWLVSLRGLLGSATVEEVELIQTLPRKVWEVRLEIVPDDQSTISFRRKARWYDADFSSQVGTLAPGTELRVRFRRAPRPLIMPAKRLPPAI